jgi:nucleotide-binding universal stress UspA family protein
MKKILYPTDFSDTAENAFLYALQVADTLGASVITLHAFDRPDISNFNLPGVLRDVYDSIDLDEFENYEDEIPLLRISPPIMDIITYPWCMYWKKVRRFQPYCGLPIRIKLHDLMIVMGATGAGRMESFFFGTISGKVLEEAHCPVIVNSLRSKI